MVKPEWGRKRSCHSCGAGFYDMRRDPIVCPKCGVEFDPLAQLRPQRLRAGAAGEEAEAAPKPKADVIDVVAVSPEDEKVPAEDDDLEALDAESDEEEIIEDASELGEDKDDMFEVMDNVEGNEET